MCGFARGGVAGLWGGGGIEGEAGHCWWVLCMGAATMISLRFSACELSWGLGREEGVFEGYG